MARLRGFERWNNTQTGCDLVIKKLNPGVDEGVGYLVSVFQDGSFKDRVKITSKKKLKDLIDSFKEFYHTDKAFLNGMLFHITYKDDKVKDKPKKDMSIEEKAHEKDDEGMKANKHAASIDEVLYKKAALIERKINMLFNPTLPVIKQAEVDETLNFINQCKQKIDAFATENKDLMNTPDSYKLYNAMEAWISEVNDNLDKSGDAHVDIEKVKQELADYFSNYTFLREKRTASSAVIITDDNIEQLIDSLDDISGGNPTDNKLEAVVDALNEVSGATDEQIDGAACIADEATKAIQGDGVAKICIATEDVIDMLVKRFRSDMSEMKYSGSLQDAVINWAVLNSINPKYAELTYKFCEADFSPNRSALRYAAMATVGVADSGDAEKAINAFATAVNAATATYPDPNANLSGILAPFLDVLRQSIRDDAYYGMAFTDVVGAGINAGANCSTLLAKISPDKFSNIAAALQAAGNNRPIIDAVNNEINEFIKANIDTAANGSLKKWVMDTALAYGLQYGATNYQAEYDEMLKTL